MTIRLSWFEAYQAAQVGAMRRIEALKRSRPEPHGAPTSDLWGIDVESAAAELAVAKALNTFWHSLASRPEVLPGDVGSLQVRSTPLPNGCLIVHHKDESDAPFVLVTGRVPLFDVVGWILGDDAKIDRFWKDPGTGRPAFFVPQKELRPMGDL